MMRLAGGRLYDPVNRLDGAIRDLYVDRGRIVAEPAAGARIDAEYDVHGRVIMAGALDLHTHIGGGEGENARGKRSPDPRRKPLLRAGQIGSGGGPAGPPAIPGGRPPGAK